MLTGIAIDVPWTEEVEILVDVGGGVGSMARDIQVAHPGIKDVYVLDLPTVVDRVTKIDSLRYVRGNANSLCLPMKTCLRFRLHRLRLGTWVGGWG